MGLVQVSPVMRSPKSSLLRARMRTEEQEGLVGPGAQMSGEETCGGRKPRGADSRHELIETEHLR